MLTIYHATARLVLDVDGLLWERYRRGLHYRGPIEEADVSPGLESEAAECLDLWNDRIDPRAEQLSFH